MDLGWIWEDFEGGEWERGYEEGAGSGDEVVKGRGGEGGTMLRVEC
jgi:hypothetical protein